MTDPNMPPRDRPAGHPQSIDEPYAASIPPPPSDPTPSPPHYLADGESPAPAARNRQTARAAIVGGLALAVALGAGVALGTMSSGDVNPAGDASRIASPAPRSAVPTTVAPTSAAPTTATPSSAAPSPTRTTAVSKPKPPSYKTLTTRQWKLIAKNPDAYIGKTYVVYGVVTQFDAATGTDTFRADVAHRRMADKYDYETNTMLTGEAADLENLVEDDIFRANVTVLSSFSYETQIGGETTTPLLMVESIKVL
ncbi:hypothetical protein FXF53_29280 [Micromonospora sp. WP24]|uniref:hypothetical protein n=1 Tax=Micromonospora sp. WP24 TaxID=2604469 RepID=UPI0011D4021F|nr:hypothetical protein [Micromonospora sp. WP24]TYB91840.1 hypothetical protein FXF53_29280 [Micromonospora sp. WP24]